MRSVKRAREAEGQARAGVIPIADGVIVVPFPFAPFRVRQLRNVSRNAFVSHIRAACGGPDARRARSSVRKTRRGPLHIRLGLAATARLRQSRERGPKNQYRQDDCYTRQVRSHHGSPWRAVLHGQTRSEFGALIATVAILACDRTRSSEPTTIIEFETPRARADDGPRVRALPNPEVNRICARELQLARCHHRRGEFPRQASQCFGFRASRSRTFRCPCMTFDRWANAAPVDKTNHRMDCLIPSRLHDSASTFGGRSWRRRSSFPLMWALDCRSWVRAVPPRHGARTRVNPLPGGLEQHRPGPAVDRGWRRRTKRQLQDRKRL